MNPVISIIIPVYNVEKYIRRCLNSVLAQTYKDYEIILVDDGSSDKSSVICDEYAEIESNIQVIHKDNQGPSHTRNVGIENAKGQYVYFLDSDDYIIPECIEILYKNLTDKRADISCGSFGFFDDYNSIPNDRSANDISDYSGRDACLRLLYGKQFNTSSCNLLLKKEIAIQNLFPVRKYHEDEMTTFRYFLAASKVVITNQPTYYYYQREGSIMHCFGQPVYDELFAADYYVDYCKEIDNDIYKASLCKKFYLYNETIKNYPQLKIENLNLYNETIFYLRRNVFSMILDLKVPIRMKLVAVKYLFKRKRSF